MAFSAATEAASEPVRRVGVERGDSTNSWTSQASSVASDIGMLGEWIGGRIIESLDTRGSDNRGSTVCVQKVSVKVSTASVI